MKKLTILLTVLLFAAAACNNEKEVIHKDAVKPFNYMVLLDLSDRLTIPEQCERDIEIIKAVFDEFNNTVRRNLVINSKDKFQVIVAPQKGIPYSTGKYENSLFLDMGSLSAGMNVNALVDFEKRLPEILQDLYTNAFLGTSTSDYPGTGIWQFFNENLQCLAASNYENNLIVLTDGYFDLEDYTRQLAEGNRYPTTSFLSSIRNKPDWKMLLEKNDLGLIPVKKEFPGMKVIVAEINPKYDFQYEADMLIYVWKKWCTEMQITGTEVMLKTSIPQTVNLLSSMISSNEFLARNF